jgi:hypothetical protein
VKRAERLELQKKLRANRLKLSSGCWVWTGNWWKQTGYGLFWLKGKRIGAHRITWVAYRGDIPKGLSVLHKCDNRICIRPSHLFLGTQLENIQDCCRKGRNRGNHRKLTDKEVEAIRVDPRSQRPIARDFKISQPYVSQIKRGICARRGFNYQEYWMRYR